MHKKNLFPAIALLLSAWAMSCTSKSADKLILGTWALNNPGINDAHQIKIEFLANKMAVSKKGNVPDPGDSMSYEIKNDGKLLVTTEKWGKIEEIEILELNAKNFIIRPKATNDTIKFVKQ